MAQQYDNTNRGALFPNDRKVRDNQPDYKGSIDVSGVEYWVSGWVKNTARGEVVSLSLEPKGQSNSQPAGGPRTVGGPRIVGGARPQNQTPQQGNMPPNNSGGGWGQGSTPQSGSQEPPMDFDDDIPF